MLKKFTRLFLVFFVTVSASLSMVSLGSGERDEIYEYYFKRNDEKKIAITFDDGPHPSYTPRILDILDRYNIKATFFVIGQNAEYYPSALKETVKRGHEIGNHTFTHTNIKNKSTNEILSELEKCRNSIYEICGENTVLFRPPGGMMADTVSDGAELFEGYDVIMWSIDTLDWMHNSPEAICNYVLGNIRSGDIILMHDYIGENSPTPTALELIIPALLEKGYKFVTVGELISE